MSKNNKIIMGIAALLLCVTILIRIAMLINLWTVEALILAVVLLVVLGIVIRVAINEEEAD